MKDIHDQIAALDRQGMGAAIKDCPRQIDHILETYAQWPPSGPAPPPEQVLFLGMGGSAIGGDMVRVWVERLADTPMTVVRGYDVPGWTGPGTLVIGSSYSGETEETLSAVRQAARRGSRIVVVASGGELLSLAETEGWGVLPLSEGLQPRAAIGYSLAAVTRVLVAHEVLPLAALDELAAGSRLMAEEGRHWSDPDEERNEPRRVAELIGDRLPVIYGCVGTTEALAVRLRSQLAENSEMLASHHLLPEQNHNEIVGLAERVKERGDLLVIWLSDADDHPRMKQRRTLASRLVGAPLGADAVRPWEVTLAGRGESLIQRNLSLLHQIDWLSYYAALAHGRNPSAIDILTELKKQLHGT
ncbi:MAG: bifunctional phosphoglucose/phosphomannose isomerase [Candidatus Neomarinimicrobiota bacterium]